MELHKYFIEKGAASMNISKQGFLQQRKKLNYEAFSFLNREYLQDFYSSDEPVLWNNYMVFAIDGSKVEVPNSDENRVAFGECGNQHSKGEVRAMASCMFDVFNLVQMQWSSCSDDKRRDSRRNNQLNVSKSDLIEYVPLEYVPGTTVRRLFR